MSLYRKAGSKYQTIYLQVFYYLGTGLYFAFIASVLPEILPETASIHNGCIQWNNDLIGCPAGHFPNPFKPQSISSCI